MHLAYADNHLYHRINLDGVQVFLHRSCNSLLFPTDPFRNSQTHTRLHTVSTPLAEECRYPFGRCLEPGRQSTCASERNQQLGQTSRTDPVRHACRASTSKTASFERLEYSRLYSSICRGCGPSRYRVLRSRLGRLIATGVVFYCDISTSIRLDARPMCCYCILKSVLVRVMESCLALWVCNLTNSKSQTWTFAGRWSARGREMNLVTRHL